MAMWTDMMFGGANTIVRGRGGEGPAAEREAYVRWLERAKERASLEQELLPFSDWVGSDNSNPTDISINCGSVGTSAASNGRKWMGDAQTKFSSLLRIEGSSTTSTAIHKLISSADSVPHKTARISRSQFSYAFQVNPGQKILRLHFNPSPYRGFKGFRDLFTIEAGPFTLLSNFSASLTADAIGVNSFSKEYCLNIQENEQLNITFSPESSQSLDTYAFINGIEIISVPASLSYFHGGDIGVQVVGEKSLVYVDHNTALEMIHRLNIKQISGPPSGDFDDTFPIWALRKADKVKNNTWKVPVDVGFRYLIRVHFSEVGLKIAGTGDVMFKILINEMIAQSNIDLVKERDDNDIPWYGDYTVMMRGHKKQGRRDLLISFKSYDELIDGHGLLAGFEIFKLSNPDNSLASPNPLPPAQVSSSKTIQNLLLVLGHRNAIVAVAITIISLVNIIVHKLREYWEASSTEEENKPSARAEQLCRRFSLVEIQLATRNFSDALLIGRGGFGKVYKGLIDRGQTTVAVKRLKSNSMQGAHEFLMEIETLSELRHVNLVSLIGYCNERREMILVYDYMAGGTLADHLYKLPRENNNFSLLWKQRLNICIGAGRGLDYLHTGHGVIHRDVKTSNILLDDNFIAKVSDFGLAKHENRNMLQSHISTRVKGTNGYLDPHYLHTRKLTRKTDTYAFGVVLLEILCGRPAVDFGVAEDEHILTMWARNKISEGEVDQIVASSLREEISPASLMTFVGIAERCLRDEPKNRPTLSQVVLQLELALEQQDNKQVLVSNEIKSASDDIRPSKVETDVSLNTGQSTMPSTHVQNLTSPPQEQTNSQVVNDGLPSSRRDGRRATTHKSSRLWPWEAFWNRVKPSRRNDLFSDEAQRRLLQWEIRFKIIIGIARGLVYLQQDSGLRVIHRDVKSINILLDIETNPKISDFGMARTLVEKISHFGMARTLVENYSDFETRVGGTIGYMSPESIMHGTFSVKSDVYSFGITMLEIVSGRRVMEYYSEHMNPNDYAWELWIEGRAYDLIDESLGGAFPEEEALRCVQVGVLCTQEQPQHRPTMPSVLKMLEGDEPLVEPQLPRSRYLHQYTTRGSVHSGGLSSDATFELDDTLER
ncbi:hypothetical protein DH2020_009245 [Rehmannia glutinosa]|uniref:Protein kinase domain-containing protein n=1 Tax=Rehmannia glutinosa TaxID=99300 RepID=A0ABR0X5P8_REHGL